VALSPYDPFPLFMGTETFNILWFDDKYSSQILQHSGAFIALRLRWPKQGIGVAILKNRAMQWTPIMTSIPKKKWIQLGHENLLTSVTYEVTIKL
jgi:hypothetical protein